MLIGDYFMFLRWVITYFNLCHAKKCFDCTTNCIVLRFLSLAGFVTFHHITILSPPKVKSNTALVPTEEPDCEGVSAELTKAKTKPLGLELPKASHWAPKAEWDWAWIGDQRTSQQNTAHGSLSCLLGFSWLLELGNVTDMEVMSV